MFEQFRFRTPDTVIFGMNSVEQVGVEAKKLGAGRAMVITDQGVVSAGLVDKVLSPLNKEKIEVEVFDGVEPEPPIGNLLDSVKMAKKGKFDVFIGLGGGSSMDVAKLTSAMVTNEGEIDEFFGVDKVPNKGLPTILVTTTSGTGSEVTRMAVLTDTDENLKKVVSAQNILGDLAIVDPMMAVTMPQRVTASTGIDAIIHAIESYVAINSNPLTDAIALEAIQLVAENLGPAFAHGGDLDARFNMALGSLLAGISLNNAGVGAVHALAYPIGGAYHVSHGVGLIVILGETLKAISMANLPKFVNIAQALGEPVQNLSLREAAEEGIEAVLALAKGVGLPCSLREIGADKSKVQEWAEAAYKEKRLLGNTPRDLTVEDIAGIFERSF